MDPGVDGGLHANSLTNILRTLGSCRPDGSRGALVLNVLLLGEKQSGRSSVGNALIGGNEFQTGVSTTTESRILSRSFQRFFRRQGAETDLVLRVMDTPPLKTRPPSLQPFCPEGVHVLVVVVRVDHPCSARAEKLAANLFGPDWRQHTLIVFTHADYLKETGLSQSDYLNQTADWMRVLSKEVGGGVCFLDNRSDWPIILGQPLRHQLLRLSAANHHRALRVRSGAEGNL